MDRKTVRVTLGQEFSDDVQAEAKARGIALRTLEDFKAYAMAELAMYSRRMGRRSFIRTMTRGMRIRRRDLDQIELEFAFPTPTGSRYAT